MAAIQLLFFVNEGLIILYTLAKISGGNFRDLIPAAGIDKAMGQKLLRPQLHVQFAKCRCKRLAG
jgi:hypothetical protein